MIYAKPIDESILESLAGTGVPLVTVEDGAITGGFGSAVAEWLKDNNRSNKLTRLGVPDRFVHHGTVAQLKALCRFDTDAIVKSLKKIVEP